MAARRRRARVERHQGARGLPRFRLHRLADFGESVQVSPHSRADRAARTDRQFVLERGERLLQVHAIGGVAHVERDAAEVADNVRCRREHLLFLDGGEPAPPSGDLAGCRWVLQKLVHRGRVGGNERRQGVGVKEAELFQERAPAKLRQQCRVHRRQQGKLRRIRDCGGRDVDLLHVGEDLRVDFVHPEGFADPGQGHRSGKSCDVEQHLGRIQSR